MKIKTISTILISLFLYSCATIKKESSSTQSTLEEQLATKHWIIIQPDSSYLGQLEFDSKSHTFQGTVGSTAIWGGYHLDKKNRIKFQKIDSLSLQTKSFNHSSLFFIDQIINSTKLSILHNQLKLKSGKNNKILLEAQEIHLNPITEKHWKLITFNGKEVIDQKKEIFFRLWSNEETVNGYSGCNNFQGTFKLNSANKIKFDGFISTKKACMQNPIDEKELFKMFQQVDNYILINDFLLLRNKENHPLAHFEAIYF